jgi:hypothetical protein
LLSNGTSAPTWSTNIAGQAGSVANGSVTPAKLSTGGLSWDTSGNVGIGTSSPTNPLDVNGIPRLRVVGGTGAGIIHDSTSGAQKFFVGTDAVVNAWRIYDYTTNTNQITIGGNVINTQANPITNCPTTAKAWVNFNGTTPITTAAGTYTRIGGTVTVTTPTNHNYSTGFNVLVTSATDSGLITLFPNVVSVTVTSATQFTFFTASTGASSGSIVTTANSIRSAYNVSSVGKSGAGDYTINFATALANANYSVSLTTTGQGVTDTARGAVIRGTAAGGASLKTTASLGILTGSTTASSLVDMAEISVTIFGN